eukprot:scaffold7213_cov118-Isochrysis_galbana.AAC.1
MSLDQGILLLQCRPCGQEDQNSPRRRQLLPQRRNQPSYNRPQQSQDTAGGLGHRVVAPGLAVNGWLVVVTGNQRRRQRRRLTVKLERWVPPRGIGGYIRRISAGAPPAVSAVRRAPVAVASRSASRRAVMIAWGRLRGNAPKPPEVMGGEGGGGGWVWMKGDGAIPT